MRQELIAQIQAVRNELDALTYMLYEDEEERDELKGNSVPMAAEPEAEYMSVQAVAEKLGVTPATIYRWARTGVIPPGKQWGPRTRRWRASDLE